MMVTSAFLVLVIQLVAPEFAEDSSAIPNAYGRNVKAQLLHGSTEVRASIDSLLIDFQRLLPLALQRVNISNKTNCDEVLQWQTRGLSPIPIHQSTLDLPINLISTLPTSLFIRARLKLQYHPGRSIFLSRVDAYARTRFAVSLNRWGQYGEFMELWIHHSMFYVIDVSPRITFERSSGGVLRSSGLLVVPMRPWSIHEINNTLTLLIELSKSYLRIATGCCYPRDTIYEATYSKTPDWYLRRVYQLSLRSRKLKTFLDSDYLNLFVRETLNNEEFPANITEMKMFFSEHGAREYCSRPPTKNIELPCEHYNVSDIQKLPIMRSIQRRLEESLFHPWERSPPQEQLPVSDSKFLTTKNLTRTSPISLGFGCSEGGCNLGESVGHLPNDEVYVMDAADIQRQKYREEQKYSLTNYSLYSPNLYCGRYLPNCESLKILLGDKGYTGPQGPVGLTGSKADCTKMSTDCETHQQHLRQLKTSAPQGPSGECGPTDLCNLQCSSLYSPPGASGLKGLKGPPGDNYRLSQKEVEYLVHETFQMYLTELSWTNNTPGRIRRVKRTTYDDSYFKSESSQFVAHTDNEHRRSKNQRMARTGLLGAIILDDIEELKTVGATLPVGAIAVSSVEYGSRRNASSMLSMFMKISKENNLWSRVPVWFGGEVTFGPSTVPELENVNDRLGFDPLLRVYLAVHPLAVNGGSFGRRVGADAMCSQLAESHLNTRGYRAFMGDNESHLEHLVPWKAHWMPVLNVAGEKMFTSWRNFVLGRKSEPRSILRYFNGKPLYQDHNQFWIGGQEYHNCDSWSSAKVNFVGLVWALNHRGSLMRSGYSHCSHRNYLLCYRIARRRLTYSTKRTIRHRFYR